MTGKDGDPQRYIGYVMLYNGITKIVILVQMMFHFLAKLRSHPIESILITTALLITVITGVIYFHSSEENNDEVLAVSDQSAATDKEVEDTVEEEMIYVEISGAVKKPDVYEVPDGTRLNELIEKSGGLSELADKDFISRNFNLSKLVFDQEKIYIPTVADIQNGLFVEPDDRVLTNLDSQSQIIDDSSPSDSSQTTTGQSDLTISINDATAEELETLPGVGPVTAQKISDGRPYTTVDELLSRKIVNSSTFEKIKEFIKL